MTFFSTVTIVAIAALAASSSSMACDSTKPRCQSLNELVKVLKYDEGIAAAQASCEANATAMRPETLNRVRPGMLMGINAASPRWNDAQEAYGQYVEDACGGVEIQGLILEGYRIAWDTRAPGEQLEKVLTAAKTSGMQGVKEQAALVSADVNRVIGNLLGQMSVAAERDYGIKLAGLATGKALEMLGSCAPGPAPVKVNAEPTLTWPPKRPVLKSM